MSSRIHPLQILIGVFVGATFFAVVANAWTGPTGAPPSNNVAAPINTSTNAQVKDGGLSVNAFAAFSNAYFAGNVGIGVTSPTERLDLGGGNISMGYEQVTNTCPGPNGAGGGYTVAGCTATCSGTKRVIGGGCGFSNGAATIIDNNPSGMSAWVCAYNTPGGQVDVSSSITTYAICANIR